MIPPTRFLLALASCAIPAFSQDATNDDLWKMMRQSPAAQTRPSAVVEQFETATRVGGNWDDPGMRRELSRRLALGALLAGKVTWPEANVRYELPEGWSRAEGGALTDIIKTYINADDDMSLIVSFTALTEGETMTREDLLKLPAGNPASARADLKPVEAKGRAAELGMQVFEGTTKKDATISYAMTVGRMIGKGALYSVCAVAKTREAADREFERFVKTWEWLDDGRDVSLPEIPSLTLGGAGFSIPIKGALMAATQTELPHGVAAARMDQRLEIAALDMRGCEVSLREMALAFLENLAVSTEGNYTLSENPVGGVAGLTARRKRNSVLLGMELDWRMDFALRDGFFCVTMGLWAKDGQDYQERHERLIEKIAFSKPTGTQDPLTEAAQMELAGLFYNEIGLAGFRKGRYEIASNAFERAVALSPKDSNIAQNLIGSLEKQGRIKSALEAVEKSRAALPDHQELKQWHAALLVRSGRDEEGQALFEDLFEGGFRMQEDLGMWIGSLQKTGRNDRATEIAQTVFDETGQLSWRRMLANCLWTAGRLDKARTHYQEMAEELGAEADFVADHAALLLEAGDFTSVLSLVKKWEQDQEVPPGMLFSKGMAQSGLGWYKDAVATFAKLDVMVPGNQTVKEAMANAQAMLGRGSHEGIRVDLEEVAIPRTLLDHAAEALAAGDMEKDHAGEGSVHLASIRVWNWTEGEDARVTQYQRIKILDASGVKAFSTLYITFKPHAERVNINRLIVTDKNGRELATYRRDEMHIRDGNGALADGEKVVCIPVPTLEEGAVIEFVHTKLQLGTSERFPMTTGGISEFTGLIYAAEAHTGDIEKMRFSATDRLKEVEGDSFHAYEARNLKRRDRHEPSPAFRPMGVDVLGG